MALRSLPLVTVRKDAADKHFPPLKILCLSNTSEVSLVVPQLLNAGKPWQAIFGKVEQFVCVCVSLSTLHLRQLVLIGYDDLDSASSCRC